MLCSFLLRDINHKELVLAGISKDSVSHLCWTSTVCRVSRLTHERDNFHGSLLDQRLVLEPSLRTQHDDFILFIVVLSCITMSPLKNGILVDLLRPLETIDMRGSIRAVDDEDLFQVRVFRFSHVMRRRSEIRTC